MLNDMEEHGATPKRGCPKLQVMICTYGKKGIERLARARHPMVDGVEYIVSWQTGDGHQYPKALEREDFKVIMSDTKGISVNRNIALSQASAPLLLISDDDTDYTSEGLHNVMSAFEEHPEADLITFCYSSALSHKSYPSDTYDLKKRRHFISSIEIAFRRKSIQRKIWFNEDFGIGATFPYGEEDIFLQDCIESGLKCIYVPKIIVNHDGETTTERNLMLPSRPQTKGAVFLRLHPYQWPLRMLAHVFREIPLWRKGLVPSPLSYCLNWLKGARRARKMKVFPTQDYSKRYSRHE